jgi:hypothetical protein
MGWVIGLDVHKDTIAAAALSPTGEVAGEAVFDNTGGGHVELHDWIISNTTEARCGLEPPAASDTPAPDICGSPVSMSCWFRRGCLPGR